MKFLRNFVFAVSVVACVTASANADVIQFNLQGVAGTGLLAGNEPGSIGGGSGGEIGAGITYDNVAKLLDVRNVGWGSSQGFTDLSSTANNSHIHVTAANFGNDGTGNFKQTGGVVFNLTRSSNAITGGVITTLPIALTTGQEADLMNGKYYINIHTSTNGGGEIRGFLVVDNSAAVPEPSSIILAGFAIGGIAFRARKRRLRQVS